MGSATAGHKHNKAASLVHRTELTPAPPYTTTQRVLMQRWKSPHRLAAPIVVQPNHLTVPSA